MKIKNKKNLITIFILCFISISIFWQFIIKGLIPFPGDFLLAWYEPWKSDHNTGSTISIIHKPIADDVFRQIYPFKVLSAKIIKDGEFPLWNPYNGAGMPLLATMHVGFFNPFNILFLFIPSIYAWSLYILTQPILIVLFTFLYSKKLGLSTYSSLFASLCFLFSGFVITRTIYGDYDHAIITLPAILYLIETYFENRKSKIILFLPFLLFYLVTSVQPQIIFYILSFSSLYALIRFNQLRILNTIDYKQILYPLFLTFLGIGLAGIQIIPTLELFQQSNINTTSSKFIIDRFLLPISHLLTIVIPNYFGNQATYNYWGAGDYVETIASIGSIPVLFAYITIIFRNKKNNNILLIFTGTIIITILLTLDWLGTRLLYSLPIPILSTSIPSRIFFLTSFSLAILAGFGFDTIQTHVKSKRKFIISLLIFFLAFTVVLIGTFIFQYMNVSCHNVHVLNCRTVALRNTLFESIFFYATFFMVLIGLTIVKNHKIRHIIIPSIIICFVIFLGYYNSYKFLPFSRKETILPENSLISALRNQPDFYRSFALGSANIKTDFASYFHFYDPNFYDPLYIKRYGNLIHFANTGALEKNTSRSDVEITNDIKADTATQERRDRLFTLLGIKNIIYKTSDFQKTDEENTLWKDHAWHIAANTKALPKAYIVNNYEIIKEDDLILKRLFAPSFDPTTTTLFEEKPEIKINNTKENISSIKITSYKENSLSIEASASKASILIINDNYYPGWHAFIDNHETKIYRVNYTLRGIVIPEGKHIITFTYMPESLKIGIAISILSAIVYLLVFLKLHGLHSFRNFTHRES